ncbi:hypothetical protein CTAYLR_004302 [Chrysophaeum taylorii]|uniref:ABC transporter domain-containing protein n=1 Tax=Chrysophaeum taylorii TaxID=2483200 RepID=A0AAD7XMY2_9STRA|nr:hypothetical protein CTAYLR_004302 [Chrysophaeum taylorii]
MDSSFKYDSRDEWDAFPLILTRLGLRVRGHQLLTSVSAQCDPGELTCVMGPSGAGKSQLLRTLAGRLPAGAVVAGYAGVGGASILGLCPRTRRDLIGYVSQEPVFCSGWETMTVGAYLDYVAILQLGFNTDYSVLKAVELPSMCAEMQIRVLSGGEKKRLSIAADVILGRAHVCLLDEPTSSLSHTDALNLVRVVSRLTASTNCVTVATIHQPGDSVFTLFDTLVLLKSGRVLYAGPRTEVLEHLSGSALPDETQTTAEWLLDTVATMKMEAAVTMRGGDEDMPTTNDAKIVRNASTFDEWRREIMVLTRRFAATLFLDASFTATPFFIVILDATIRGLLMFNPSSSVAGAFTRLYAASISPTQSHQPSVPLVVWYCNTLAPSLSEMRNGRYRYGSFVVAVLVCVTARTVLMTIPTMTLYYWMVGWYPSEWLTTAVFEMFASHSLSVGAVLCAVVGGNPTIATLLYILALVLNYYLRGVYFSQRVMPTAISYFSDCLPLRWAADGVSTSQLRGRSYECKGDEALIYSPCPVRGGDILALFDMGETKNWVLRFGLFELACAVVICLVLDRIVMGRVRLAKKSTQVIVPENFEPCDAMDEQDDDHPKKAEEGEGDDSVGGDPKAHHLMTLLDRDVRHDCVPALNVEQLSVVTTSGKTLLRDVSFSASTASLTAIFGNSGSGKSTMLKAIAGRIPATGRMQRHPVAYVQQDAQLPEWLDVRELFAYHAELRGLQQEGIVDATIDFLGLTRVMKTKTATLSGGELRRCSLGVDGILSARPWLLMDEPTTGLSASDALRLTKNLHALADAMRWVVLASLHSPRVEIFLLFDAVVLLGKGVQPLVVLATSMSPWVLVDDVGIQVMHEMRCGKYAPLPALTALVAVNAVRLLVFAALPAVVPVYFLAGLRGSLSAFLHFLATTWICSMYGFACLLLLIGVYRTKERMSSWMGLALVTGHFSGLLRAIADYPLALRWFARHFGVFYFMVDVATTTQLPATLRCGGEEITVCPVRTKDYLRETHSYAQYGIRSRYLRSIIVVLVLGALGSLLIARQVRG